MGVETMPMGFGGWWILPLVGMGMMAVFGWLFFSRILGRPLQPSRTLPPPIPPVDPLEVARERFAQGLISKEEFDELAERLVRTEKPH